MAPADMVNPRWSSNVAESAELALTSRSWSKVSQAACSAIQATHNYTVHTHNCKQLFITHSDLWLVAALMAPDPEVNAQTRRGFC